MAVEAGWMRLLPRSPTWGGIIVLVAALAFRIYDPMLLERARNISFDTLQELKPRVPSSDWPVVIVDIDEESLRRYGQWPWPRTRMAAMVDKLTEAGVAVVAFDVVFSEPDRTSPKRIIGDWPVGDDVDLRKRVESLPDHDAVFAGAIKRGNVVLGFHADPAAPPRKVQGHGGISWAGDEILPFLFDVGSPVSNLPELVAAAKGNGSFMTGFVGDAVIRQVPLLFKSGDQPYASLSGEAVRVALGATTYLARLSGASGAFDLTTRRGIFSLRIGGGSSPISMLVDVTGNARVYLYDSGHRKERYLSAAKVFDGEFKPENLEGRIIMVGTSAPGLLDLRSTPLEPVIPGVEVHAQIVEQILASQYLDRPFWAGQVEWLFVLVLGLALIGALYWLGVWWAGVLLLLSISAALGASWIGFAYLGWLVDPIFPALTMLVIFMVHTFLSYLQSEVEKRRVRDTFKLYLSPEFIEELAAEPDRLKLGGELRELTVMFTDIRGFTSISEKLDPPGLARFINGVLTPMTDTIMSLRGTVDKYIGDAIMAFWNAPLSDKQHARNACLSALGMQVELKRLNVIWKAEAEAEGREPIPVRIGIGLNSGDASVGNFGSDKRFAYSAMGDSVNLASRLEGQCKTYVVDVIVGEATHAAAPDLAYVELDLLRVKGKTRPERIYALAGDSAMATTSAFAEWQSRHMEFLAAYRAGEFERAAGLIEECRQLSTAAGWEAGYYDVMAMRMAMFRQDPPPANWDGVFDAETK